MGAYAIPGIFLPFLIAFLANKFNKKSMILIALLTLIIGLIAFALSGSFVTLLAYRLVAGIGATVLIVLAPLLVTMFFDERNIGIAMGIFNTAVPCGTVLATNLFGILGEIIEWRSIILGIAAFAGGVLAISFFALSLPKGKDIKESHISERESSHGFWSDFRLWLLALVWALVNAQLLSYVTFGPQYFQTFGMTIQRAGLLTSFIMLIPIFLSPVVGIIIDKTGWKKPLLLAGSMVMAISFILIGRTTLNAPLWTIGLGIGFTPIPVLVFALLPEMVEPHQIGMGLGMLTSASNLGIAMGPSGFGLLLDMTKGNFYIGFMTLALVSIGIIFILSGLKIKTKHDL